MKEYGKNSFLTGVFLSILFSLLLAENAGAQDFKYGRLYYNKISENEVVVTSTGKSYLIYTGDIVIPESVGDNDEFTVVGIDDNAFYYSDIRSVVLPATIKWIGNSAFKFTELKSIYFPEGLIKIDDRAFNGTQLEKIELPSSLEYLGESSFSHCYSLSSVYISSGVSYVGGKAFSNCYSLKQINVSEDNPYYTSLDGLVYDKMLNELVIFPPGCDSFVFPESMTVIGENVFAGSESLTYFKVPSTVTVIKKNAFQMCNNLTKVDLHEGLEEIGEGSFDCTGIKSIKIPPLIKKIQNRVFFANSELREVIWPPSLEEIGDEAFYDTPFAFVTLEIPSSVVSIGERAFMGEEYLDYSYLKEIKLGSGLKHIGKHCFYYNKKINKVYCSSPEPPTCGGRIFMDEIHENATLYVPADSYEIYKNTEPWCFFKNIEPSGDASLNQITEVGKESVMYDLSGRKVGSHEVASGIYIINGKKIVVSK